MNEFKNARKLISIIFLLISSAVGPFVRAEGVKSHYTDSVQTLLKEDMPAPESFELTCWTDPKNDLYMGVEQRLHIAAPFATVSAVMMKVDDYVDLFPDYKEIKLVSKKDEHFTVYFEQKVPIFFIPNVKYEMLYTELNPTPDKKILWYQLKDPGTVKASDGLVILKKTADGNTDYTEYDFFDANWGAAKIAGTSKLWRDVVDGIYRSDLAVKIKSEDMKLTATEARKLAEKQKQDKLIEACVEKRSEWKSELK